MKNIWTSHKLAIIILSYIIIASSVIYFLALPLVKEIQNTSNQIQEKLADQQVKQNRLSKLPQMEKDWSDYQSQKKDLDVTLGSSDEVGFIESLESLAGQTKNSINLQIGKPVDSKKLAKTKRSNQNKNNSEEDILDGIHYKKYFPVKISLKGDYNGLINFIHKLENFNFYINIISIDVKKEKIVQDQNSAQAKLFPSGIFSKNAQNKDSNSVQKEILNSNLNVIVYTKS